MVTVRIWKTLGRIPGGLVITPLVIGAIVGTFAPQVLELGGFTTGLFKNSVLPLIGLMIFAVGANTPLRTSGLVLSKTAALLLAKTIIPGLLLIAYGHIVGRDFILPGVCLLALMAALTNSNGTLWLVIAEKYGDITDVGAYIASGMNDGPFFTLLFLGAGGLAQVPIPYLIGTILPYILGLILGNLDPDFAERLRPVPVVAGFFALIALGASMNLYVMASGFLGGIIIGLISSLGTGYLGYLMYKIFFKNKTKNPGVGFAIGTTAGNAVVTPKLVADADPSYLPYVSASTASISAAVFITAILTPMITHYLCMRNEKKFLR